MSIGEFVRKKRREANLSQSELAEKAGVGLNFVYQLEKNKETVQLNCALSVLHALGFELAPTALPEEIWEIRTPAKALPW